MGRYRSLQVSASAPGVDGRIGFLAGSNCKYHMVEPGNAVEQWIDAAPYALGEQQPSKADLLAMEARVNHLGQNMIVESKRSQSMRPLCSPHGVVPPTPPSTMCAREPNPLHLLCSSLSLRAIACCCTRCESQASAPPSAEAPLAAQAARAAAVHLHLRYFIQAENAQ